MDEAARKLEFKFETKFALVVWEIVGLRVPSERRFPAPPAVVLPHALQVAHQLQQVGVGDLRGKFKLKSKHFVATF